MPIIFPNPFGVVHRVGGGRREAEGECVYVCVREWKEEGLWGAGHGGDGGVAGVGWQLNRRWFTVILRKRRSKVVL